MHTTDISAAAAARAPLCVAALYQFAPFEDPAALRAPLLALCEAQGIRGTLLLAREGINGTIAGSREGLDAVIAHIRALPGCEGLDVKFSSAAETPFHRMKVRLKREIVTMGEPGTDPLATVGTYVQSKAGKFNKNAAGLPAARSIADLP